MTASKDGLSWTAIGVLAGIIMSCMAASYVLQMRHINDVKASIDDVKSEMQRLHSRMDTFFGRCGCGIPRPQAEDASERGIASSGPVACHRRENGCAGRTPSPIPSGAASLPASP